MALTPRQKWLQDRVIATVNALQQEGIVDNWKEYMDKAKEFASEVLYAVTEWEKHYADCERVPTC